MKICKNYNAPLPGSSLLGGDFYRYWEGAPTAAPLYNVYDLECAIFGTLAQDAATFWAA